MRKYTPVNFSNVKLEGEFWRERLETVLTHTIPSQHRKLVEFNMLDSLTVQHPVPPLTIPRGKEGFTTQIFWDSDIGKWIEAASYALSHRRDDVIEKQIDEITLQLEKTQAPSGYLNCWYLQREPENEWTNLRDNHELYNAGHMLEGAVAYFQATGRRRLLDVMEKYVDHIGDTFGMGDNQKPGYPGHQEIELALIKLYGVTKDKKHLDLATYFINQRGSQPHYFDIERDARGESPEAFSQTTYEYNQSHVPVREQDKVVGHAVRAMYMYAAMADLASELSDDSLKSACETLWRDITETRMYITGGFGPSESNEGFTTDYDLPNDTAYAETCASVAMVFWAQRMLNIDLDSQYADILELALYNNSLAGLSRDGEHYFYDNKLDSDGTHSRWGWHHCPCCTMNASRLIASVAGYFYSTSDESLAIHLYGTGEAGVSVGANSVTIKQVSDYPWSGQVSVEVLLEKPIKFDLKLRIPGWAKGATAQVNGEAIDARANLENGYLTIGREWASGDIVRLDLPMPAERIYAHPHVKADVGRVALRRGPLVYCLEQHDNGTEPVSSLRLPQSADIRAVARDDLFGGIVMLQAEGVRVESIDWTGDLYRATPPMEVPATLLAVPYYVWCNRGPNPMQVWTRE
jgi:DUF1680 family protein